MKVIAALKSLARLRVEVFASAAILTGCASVELPLSADYLHEHLSRDDCRSECRLSRYAEGVGTECYGRCMEKSGYFCFRDFSVSCDTVGCIGQRDNFRCRGSAPEKFAACVEERESLKPNFADFADIGPPLADLSRDSLKTYKEAHERWLSPCVIHK